MSGTWRRNLVRLKTEQLGFELKDGSRGWRGVVVGTKGVGVIQLNIWAGCTRRFYRGQDLDIKPLRGSSPHS